MSSDPGCPFLCHAPWVGPKKPWSQSTPGRRAAQGATSGPTAARDASGAAKAEDSPPRGHHATRHRFGDQPIRPRSAIQVAIGRSPARRPRSEKGIIRCHPPANSHCDDGSDRKWLIHSLETLSIADLRLRESLGGALKWYERKAA